MAHEHHRAHEFQSVGDEERGWLVEMVNPVTGACGRWLYHGSITGVGWTTDPNRAIRLARRDDAWALGRIVLGTTVEWLPTEHVWVQVPDQVRACRPA